MTQFGLDQLFAPIEEAQKMSECKQSGGKKAGPRSLKKYRKKRCKKWVDTIFCTFFLIVYQIKASQDLEWHWTARKRKKTLMSQPIFKYNNKKKKFHKKSFNFGFHFSLPSLLALSFLLFVRAENWKRGEKLYVILNDDSLPALSLFGAYFCEMVARASQSFILLFHS